VSKFICTERYLVLDSKTHFVFPLNIEFLEAADGRANINAYSYEAHPLRGDLERVLLYVGLPSGKHVPWFTATVAPFVLYTEVVRGLVADVEARSGCPFAVEFVDKSLTEFFLYGAYLLRKGSMEELYYEH
jgi:hypothetical protein